MSKQSIQHSFEDEIFLSLCAQRNNWAKVAVGSTIASLLALGVLIAVLPIKETKPYVVLVDKTTGEAEKIVQVRPATLQQQEAVLQAELVSYVVDRETYDSADNKTRIPDVMTRSSGNAREILAETWRSGSAQYPPVVYGDDVRVRVVVKSISLMPSHQLNTADLARVRIVKYREQKGREAVRRSFVATIGYQFRPQINVALEAVWKNPLGFEVSSYRIDAETAD
ncbi:type IV secretion system protein (plasmid) [Bradyrhizobium sp. 183]|uniref:virB8 family protein n=1 Tax=unclassified Bradyrhizobium TaxID=2631580 RepID=UPI001FFF697C|nr:MULTISPECIES: type IV secretion system protein [unclassified Bradyrhizobium]UPJ84958.1 type IV secretion system protein [Bradyrhizobium sp. 184]UPJ92746.1 type IV secretion system protein [Bradyrhizobium sp. 183]